MAPLRSSTTRNGWASWRPGRASCRGLQHPDRLRPLGIGPAGDRLDPNRQRRLIYDFGGFDPKYYRIQYPSPGAPDLAEKVAALMPDREHVAFTNRGLDHGAYVPLMAMYPKADIPVLQISLPTLDPDRLIDLGRRLRPLRDEGVLIIGSGFLTHGLPFLRDFRIDAPPPGWSAEFDAWAAEAFARGTSTLSPTSGTPLPACPMPIRRSSTLRRCS